MTRKKPGVMTHLLLTVHFSHSLSIRSICFVIFLIFSRGLEQSKKTLISTYSESFLSYDGESSKIMFLQKLQGRDLTRFLLKVIVYQTVSEMEGAIP